MAIEFNKFNKDYNKYNLLIGAGTSKQAKKAEETKDVENSKAEFKGLENETDLLTKNTAYLYNTKLGNFTLEDKDFAENTNAILASLGYNYKVSAAQVASVANGVRNTILPGLELARNGAVAARIEDPNGPFADLFIS